GSDIAFLGGLVNYVLSNDKWFKEYVLAYTNASVLIDPAFHDTEDLAGLFSGYHGDGLTGKYDAAEGHWGYEGFADGSDRPGSGKSTGFRVMASRQERLPTPHRGQLSRTRLRRGCLATRRSSTHTVCSRS